MSWYYENGVWGGVIHIYVGNLTHWKCGLGMQSANERVKTMSKGGGGA